MRRPLQTTAALYQVPNTLVGKQIIELDMGMIVAGTKYRVNLKSALETFCERLSL